MTAALIVSMILLGVVLLSVGLAIYRRHVRRETAQIWSAVQQRLLDLLS